MAKRAEEERKRRELGTGSWSRGWQGALKKKRSNEEPKRREGIPFL